MGWGGFLLRDGVGRVRKGKGWCLSYRLRELRRNLKLGLFLLRGVGWGEVMEDVC